MLDCILAKWRTMHRLTSQDKHTQSNVKYMCPDMSHINICIYINTSLHYERLILCNLFLKIRNGV